MIPPTDEEDTFDRQVAYHGEGAPPSHSPWMTTPDQ